MREIKFRGQKLNSKEFIYGQLAYFFNNKENTCIMPNCYFGTRDFGEEDDKGNPVIENELALGGFVNVSPDTIGQYTGLKDKNCKEIYEGDIFKYDLPSSYEGDEETTYIEEVRFVQGLFELDNFPLGSFHDMGVVIGNIYENPELING